MPPPFSLFPPYDSGWSVAGLGCDSDVKAWDSCALPSLVLLIQHEMRHTAAIDSL